MPTIRRCCIVGCLSNSRQNPSLQFFQFPRPENPFQKLWKQACHASLSRILPFKKPVVCALHFAPNCIGGRRLTSSAVPSLRLEVPSNLKAVEQQAMLDEIERSRKCAYINAVVYEWLVRANLNPQLRGSITHGMIKEKADTAKQLIGSNSFIADNRWLNRFRETHLTGFAQKLATNQLKPLGPSLWIPDIVQDLQHLFPPTSADRVANFENVPEQYINYMQQYGEYEEEDEDQKPGDLQSYQEQQQQQLSYQHQQHNQATYDPYAHPGTYGYDDYYYNEHNQSHHSNYSSPHHHNQHQQQAQHHQQHEQHHIQQQQQLQHQHQQQSQQQQQQLQQQRPASHSPVETNSNRASPYPQNPAKHQKLQEDEEIQIINGNGAAEQIEDLTDGPEPNQNSNGRTSKTNGSNASPTNAHSNSASPKLETNHGNNDTNQQTNGHSKTASVVTANDSSATPLDTYSQALEYLKPLEDFALFKENFRAIGLISQLEVILRKGDRVIIADPDV